jgi:hypothetical protein
VAARYLEAFERADDAHEILGEEEEDGDEFEEDAGGGEAEQGKEDNSKAEASEAKGDIALAEEPSERSV